METRISGWANTLSSQSSTVKAKTAAEVREAVQLAKTRGLSIIARGAGQSYGDEALNGSNLVVDLTGLNRILDWDEKPGLLKVEPGVTYTEALKYCLPNWTLSVIPGTRFVTLGGALANNVHGKNSFDQGNFGEWVREFKIIVASGEELVCSPTSNADLFRAVIGGAGLLGIVTEITIQLRPIPSPFLSVGKFTAENLEAVLKKLGEASQKEEYAIAQIDAFAKGHNLGRGTLHSASFIKNEKSDWQNIDYISPHLFGIVPKKIIPFFGKWLLNDWIMRLVSSLKYHLEKRLARQNLIQDIFDFTFFLDKVPNWKQVFRHGFFEYEPLLPKDTALSTIRRLIELTHEYNMPAYLAAIKLHRSDDFLLSYSLPGYSLALDIPREPKRAERQAELFKKMTEIVIEAGGIIYLAKDATLTPQEFRAMYPRLPEFLAIKSKCDPDQIFQSDLYRRIFKN